MGAGLSPRVLHYKLDTETAVSVRQKHLKVHSLSHLCRSCRQRRCWLRLFVLYGLGDSSFWNLKSWPHGTDAQQMFIDVCSYEKEVAMFAYGKFEKRRGLESLKDLPRSFGFTLNSSRKKANSTPKKALVCLVCNGLCNRMVWFPPFAESWDGRLLGEPPDLDLWRTGQPVLQQQLRFPDTEYLTAGSNLVGSLLGSMSGRRGCGKQC